MTVKTAVLSHILELADENGWSLPELTDDLVLLDSGLDSLAIAVLVVRLEEALDVDPFSAASDLPYPVTIGDFIKFYEHAVERRAVAADLAG
jgi:acyl carrier protein